MRLLEALKFLAVTSCAALLLAACASAPTQEMADARQALQAARDAEAATHAPVNLSHAEGLISDAEQALERHDFGAARGEAVAAKKAAVAARNVALAIAGAVDALAAAERLGVHWRGSRSMLDEARAAAAAGDEATAVRLANRVKFQGRAAVGQHYLEQARLALQELSAYEAHMNAGQRARYQQAREALRDREGRRANELAQALLSELRRALGEPHVVVPGDHPWGISARPAIYGDPDHWPLTYKADSRRIDDPGLSHPGQDPAIGRGHGGALVDAAVAHARGPGAWALGALEAADRTYPER